MKNLKKVLALVMALVMVMGMVVSASAADLSVYSDSSKITYKEALEVMTEIGVINGFEDGTMRPDETLTRAQAAKIISYLALGKTAADSLSTTSAPFTDVAATNWAAGSIAYCVSAGIIDGYGDGTFGPNDTLTGYQFAKMLLATIGYGKKDEFTGSTWAIEVAKLALLPGINLFKGNGADANNNPISRQSAMQCALNALSAPKVVYSDLFGSYTYSLLGSQSVDYGYLSDSHSLKKVGAADGYGYNGHKWQVKNKDITGIYSDDEIVTTYTDASKVTYGQLANLGDWTKDKGTTEEPYFEMWINGSDVTTTYAAALSNVARGNSTELADAFGIGLAGADFNVVKDPVSGKIYKIVVVIEYLAQVTKVNAKTASADRTVDLEVYDVYGVGSSAASVTGVEAEDFDEDDYVVIVPSANTRAGFKTPLSLKAAESVNTVVTRKGSSGANSLIFGGQTYYYGDFAAADDLLVPMADIDFTTTYTFYLASNGYILGSEIYRAGTTSTNYVYVSEYAGQVGTLITGGAQAKVKVYHMDGTSEVLDMVVKSVSGDPYISVNGTNNVLVGNNTNDVAAGVYAYTMSSGKIATLNTIVKTEPIASRTAPAVSAKAITTGSLVLTKNSASVGSDVVDGSAGVLRASSSTVLTLVSGSGSVTTYTGFANFPTKTYAIGNGTGSNDAKTVVYTYVDGKALSNILVIGAGAVTPKADTYAYYIGTGAEDADGTYYKFIVNNDTMSYQLSEDSQDDPTMGTTDVYALSLDKDGKAMLIEQIAADSTYAVGTVVKATGDYVEIAVAGVGNVIYYTTSSTQIYDVTGLGNTPAKWSRISLSSATKSLTVGSTVKVACSESDNQKTAEVIYLTVQV